MAKTTITLPRPVSATWNGETLRVRSVTQETAYYLPDANGQYVTVIRKVAQHNPRAVRVVTVTTRAARETHSGLLYRMDMRISARDRETLATFLAESTLREPSEVWEVSSPVVLVVRYL